MRACCDTGLCATHLAEQRDGSTHSTIHLGRSLAVVPNYDEQQLVGAFCRVAIDLHLQRLGR